MPPIVVVDYKTERRARIQEDLVQWHSKLPEDPDLAKQVFFGKEGERAVMAFLHLSNPELFSGLPCLLEALLRAVVGAGGRAVCYTGGEIKASVEDIVARSQESPKVEGRVALMNSEVWTVPIPDLKELVAKLVHLKEQQAFDEHWSASDLFARDSAVLVLYMLASSLVWLSERQEPEATEGSMRARLRAGEGAASREWWGPAGRLARGGDSLCALLRTELAPRGRLRSDDWPLVERFAESVEAFLWNRAAPPPALDSVRAAESALRRLLH